MPGYCSQIPLFTAAGATCLALAVVLYPTFRSKVSNTFSPTIARFSKHLVNDIRKHLPADLPTWRDPPDVKDGDDRIWLPLYNYFESRGYIFWDLTYPWLQCPPDDRVTNPFGYGYAHLHHGWEQSSTFMSLHEFPYPNPLCRAARTQDGRDVVIRVLAIGSQGQEQVDILKFVAQEHYAAISTNHTIPLLDLIHFEDITFGVFPKIGFPCRHVLMPIFKDSVGDILDVLLQCLESLAFLHYAGIAHRDAWLDNFLFQYHPASLDASESPRVTRPRVFITDFEFAVRLRHSLPPEERVCRGPPTSGSAPSAGDYKRPLPSEVLSGDAYDPFKLDVWQLSVSVQDFESTIPEIDAILEWMRHPDAAERPYAREALQKLHDVIASTPPRDLAVHPITAYSQSCIVAAE